MAAITIWLLPDPDSPTTATVSLASTWRSTPFTASTSPSTVRNRTRKPLMEKIGSAMA